VSASGPTLGEPKPVSRRASRWRRLARLAIVLSLAGLGSSFVALVFLHTPLGRNALRSFLEANLGPALGGKLRLGSLRYRLSAGTLDVGALRLKRKGVVLDVADVHARWSPRDGLHVSLERPVLVVRDTDRSGPAAPAIGLAAGPWLILERFSEVEITTGRVELQDRRGVPYLALDPLDATMQVSGGRRAIRLTLRNGAFTPAGRARLPLSGIANLHLAGGGLVIDGLHLATKGASAELDGVIDRVRPERGTASVVLDAEAALATLFLPGSDLSGHVRAQADIELQGTLSGKLRASSPALRVQGVGPWETSLRARFDSRRLTIEAAQALGYGGRLTASGPIAFGGTATTDLVVGAEDMDAAALARAAGAALPVRSRLRARLRWTTTGLALDRARGAGELTLQPVVAPTSPPVAEVPGLALAGAAKLLVAGRQLQLHALQLDARGLHLAGELTLTPALGLQGSYRAELPLASLPALAADLGAGARLPALVGRLVAEGEIGGPPGNPFATLQLHGEGIGTAAAAHAGTGALTGNGRLAGGRLALESLVVRSSGGGRASWTGGLPLTAAGGDWELLGEIQALELAPLLASLGFAGHGPLDGRVRVAGPRSEPTAHADLEARLTLAAGSPPIEASFSGTSSGTLLVLERLEAAVGGGRVQAGGSFDRRSRALTARVRAEGVRLAQLPAPLPASLRALDGTLGADLTLGGTTDAPTGELHGSLTKASYGESPLAGLTLTARADGRDVDLVGASSDPAFPGYESVFLRGGGPLQGEIPLRLKLDAAALPLQRVLEAIPVARRQAASLALEGAITIELPLRAPGKLRYTSDGLVANGRVRDVEWRTLPFRIEGAADEATVSGLRVTATSSSPASPPPDRERAAGAASGRDAPDTTGAVVARARADGRPAASAAPGTTALAGGTLAVDGRIAISARSSFDLALECGLDLAALQRLTDSRLAGTARLQLQVRGTAATPELRGQLTLADGRGRFGSLRVSGAQLLARLQGAEATIERLEARALGGRLTASGAVPLRRLPEGAAARLHFEATDLDLSRLTAPATQRDPDAPSFLVSLAGEVAASAPDLAEFHGGGRVTRAEQESPEGRLTLEAPAQWTLERGRLELAPLRLVGTLGTLEARAETRLAGGPFAGSARLSGPFDLRVVGPFLEDTTLAGPARVDLRASWDAKGVRLDGGLSVEDGRLTLEALAFTLTQLKGELRLLGERATVEATAASGDGRLRLGGGMTFGPSLLGPAQLHLDAERLPISYPEGFRARAGGALRLNGRPGAYRIQGEIALTQASYTAEFDEKKRSLDRLERQLAALQGAEPVGESLPLSVRVRFVDSLRVRNERAQLDVVGEFAAGGTLSHPTASGQVTLLEGGTVRIRHGELRLQQGRVELNGYPAGNPEFELNGSSQIAGIEMDVRAHGTLEDLRLDISSPNRPDLSQTDLVSLLLTGRTAQTAAAQSTTIVAEELASTLGSVVQRNVGELLLVDVGPERSLLTDSVDPTRRFSLGARLRQDLIVLYSTRLDGTEQRWIVEWNPRGSRLRLRALDDETEGLAFEIADRLSFDLVKRPAAARPAPREAAKLAALRFEGELPLPEQELRAAAKLKLGRAVGSLRRDRAADRVRQRLVADGWLCATVDAESTPTPGQARSSELTLRVHAGPRIRIAWAGDDPGKKIRAQVLASWPAYASPDSGSAIVARTARVLLQTDRYYLAKVEHELISRGGEAELRLLVEKGPRGREVAVAFEGNEVLDDDALRAVLPRPGSREFFEALAGRGDRLSGALRIAYAQVGYLRTRVLTPRSGFEAASGRLYVLIPVRERGASRVSQLILPRELKETGADAPTLALREGQPFALDAYMADREAVGAWYRNAGWMEARVRGVLEPSADELRVRIEVAPGPRLRAGRIRIESTGRSRPAMVRRAVVVEPGALVRPQELSESRARLSELGVFRSVDVRPVPPQENAAAAPAATARADAAAAEPGGVGDEEANGVAEEGSEAVGDIAVSYVERPDVTLEYGLRYSTTGAAAVGGAPSSPAQGRLQISGALELTNPFGWGWHVRPFALLTRDRHAYGVAFEAATLFGLRVHTQLLVSDDDDNRNTSSTLASRIRGVSLQQSRALVEDTSPERRHDRLRLQWGYADKRIEYFDSDGLGTTLAGRRSSLSLSLVGDERDSLTDPHRGLFWTASSEIAREALGSDVNYVRLYGQLFLYVPLPARLVWAQGFRAGVAPGENPLLLLENRFQAGGPTTVRGYGQDDLGPQTPDGIGLGGQGVLILNQELRFPIWSLVSGGVFWDAGNVWARAGDVRLGELRQSVGAGLRVMLPFGPVRVEYAWNVGPHRGTRGGRFVFGLGHAF
jgi:outer membrane protein assembly factor BamA